MSSTALQIPGYEILNELGLGGMSTVYLALQRSLDRKVAIKVMRANMEDADKFERRFLMEGRTMAKLPHRNIVAVYDIVKNADATYIAMEYLEGGTLSQRMKDGLSLSEAIGVIVQIAGALQFAHDHGVIHRDLKPANIMFRDPHTPVLTDFGIARHADASQTRLTQTGMLVGTPTYMSPEQINALEVDGRSDLYSLGVLFFELLTGTPPFHADTPIAVLMAHLTQPLPPLPAQFAKFEPVVAKMLAKNRDDRYAGMKEFSKALKALLVGDESLWARLQADPSQSSSEQLRALGFSTSQPTGEGMPGPMGEMVGRHSAQTRQPSGLNRVPSDVRKPPSSLRRKAVSVAPVEADDEDEAVPTRPAARGGRGLWAALAVVLVLLLGAGAWWIFDNQGLDATERELVAAWLKEVDRQIEARKYVAPAEDNAFETLQKVLQKAENFPPALAKLDSIVKALRDDAQAALTTGDYAQAMARVNEALLVKGDAKDDGLLVLKAKVDSARSAAEKKQRVEALVVRAGQAHAAGRDFGPEGAYALLSAARAIDDGNAEVKGLLKRLVDGALREANEALQRGDINVAAAALLQVEADLAAEPAFAVLKGNIEAARKLQQRAGQIAALLERARGQLNRGQLLDPVGDNALESLDEAARLDAKDSRVVAARRALASELSDQARVALAGGQAQFALERAVAALQLEPGRSDAATLKRDAEARLGERQVQITRTLTAAKQAMNEQRFLAPPGNNARDALAALLKLDPTNSEGKSLVADLPKRIGDAIESRESQGDLAGATELAQGAAKAYPDDQRIATLSRKIAGAQQAAAQQAARAEKLTNLARIAAQRPLPSSEVLTAARDLNGMLKSNAGDVDAQRVRDQLSAALIGELQVASTLAELDARLKLLNDASSALGGSANLNEAAQSALQKRTKLVAEEEARLASLRGQLILNAAPWGKVISVQDQNKVAVALPADTTTPVTLTLPAGTYYVTLSHPQTAKPVSLFAKVEASKSVSASATFPTLSAKDYFTRVGL